MYPPFTKKSMIFLDSRTVFDCVKFVVIIGNTFLWYDICDPNYRRNHMAWRQIGTRLSAAIGPGYRYQAALSGHGQIWSQLIRVDVIYATHLLIGCLQFNHQQKSCPGSLLLTGIKFDCSIKIINVSMLILKLTNFSKRGHGSVSGSCRCCSHVIPSLSKIAVATTQC